MPRVHMLGYRQQAKATHPRRPMQKRVRHTSVATPARLCHTPPVHDFNQGMFNAVQGRTWQALKLSSVQDATNRVRIDRLGPAKDRQPQGNHLPQLGHKGVDTRRPPPFRRLATGIK
jgi:hypothetical protein